MAYAGYISLHIYNEEKNLEWRAIVNTLPDYDNLLSEHTIPRILNAVQNVQEFTLSDLSRVIGDIEWDVVASIGECVQQIAALPTVKARRIRWNMYVLLDLSTFFRPFLTNMRKLPRDRLIKRVTSAWIPADGVITKEEITSTVRTLQHPLLSRNNTALYPIPRQIVQFQKTQVWRVVVGGLSLLLALGVLALILGVVWIIANLPALAWLWFASFSYILCVLAFAVLSFKRETDFQNVVFSTILPNPQITRLESVSLIVLLFMFLGTVYPLF